MSPTLSAPVSLTALVGALNLSSDAVIIYQPMHEAGIVKDLEVVVMNDAAVHMCHISRELSVGMNYQTLWAMDKEGFIWMKFLDVLYTNVPHSYEWEMYSGGETKWYEVNLQNYGSYIAASYRDITARKRNLIAEQSQRMFYEEMMRGGLRRKTLLKAIRNADGAITDFLYEYVNYGAGINDQHRHLADMPMITQGKVMTDVFPSIRQHEVWAFMVSLANNGIPATMISRYNHDGVDAQAEIDGQRLEDGRVLLEHTALDQIEKMAAKLQIKRDDLDAVLEATPVGITIFSAVRGNSGEIKDFEVRRCNKLAARFSQRPLDEYIPGMRLSAGLPRRLKAHFNKLIEVFLAGGVYEEEQYQPELRKWVSIRVSAYKDGLLSVAQDITAIRNARQHEQVG